jgi:hypothetical protein
VHDLMEALAAQLGIEIVELGQVEVGGQHGA